VFLPKIGSIQKAFIEQNVPSKRKAPKISIDFSDDTNAHDMLKQIMKSKNLTAEKAILSSITQKIV